MRLTFSNKMPLPPLLVVALYFSYLFVTIFLLRLYFLPGSTGTDALLGEIVKGITWVGPVFLLLKYVDREKNIWLSLRFCNWRKGLVSGGAGVCLALVKAINPILSGQVHAPHSWMFLVVFALTAPIEEIAFRGFIQQKIKALSDKWIAVGVTTLLFACIHIPQFLLSGSTTPNQILPQLMFVALVGFLYSVMFEYSDSIIGCILFHYAYDAVLLFI